MATFDLTTREGLRDPCGAAERKLAQNPRVETIAKFLQEVDEASDEERQSEAFQRRVWDRSPLYDLEPNATDGDLTKHLADAEFPRWFHELVVRHLPVDAQQRAERLDDRIGDAMALGSRGVLGQRIDTLVLYPKNSTCPKS